MIFHLFRPVGRLIFFPWEVGVWTPWRPISRNPFDKLRASQKRMFLWWVLCGKERRKSRKEVQKVFTGKIKGRHLYGDF